MYVENDSEFYKQQVEKKMKLHRKNGEKPKTSGQSFAFWLGIHYLI